MSLSRPLKMKEWAGLFFLILIFLCTLSILSSNTVHEKNQPSKDLIKPVGETYNRLTSSHQQLLNSALAHIRLGYVANRTPHYSTPPLLLLYSLRQEQNQKKPLDEHLLDITNTYYFSMLQPGSAFAYDMNWPVKIEWFFNPSPSYMAMTVDQANYYRERTQPNEIKDQTTALNEEELSETPFLKDYTQKNIKIVSTTHWKSMAWMNLRENPSMIATRDHYRLNHLPQKSDWFWLSSRLLFSSPQGHWFAQQMEPYKEIMGGRLDYSESLSPYDPQAGKVTPEFAIKKWMRIGLRVSAGTTDEEIKCLVDHVNSICQKEKDHQCHVFISAPNRTLLKATRNNISRNRKVSVHAVADGYGFKDLDQEPDANQGHGLFSSEEDKLRKEYARTFMDWMILSRMDYLVGQQNDNFLKTAAWAAQVQTDINTDHCSIIPMSDW